MPFPDYEPCTPAFIRSLAQRYGNHDLIVYEGRRLTYGQAEAASATLARGFLARGVGKGTRVGLLMPNSPEFVVAWLAATRVGAIIVPINTFYKPRELRFVLQHADIEVLLSVDQLLSNNYVERLDQCCSGLADHRASAGPLLDSEFPYLRHVYLLGDTAPAWAHDYTTLIDASESVGENMLEATENCVVPADTAAIIYSSGSTADPKGAVHTQGSVIRHSFNLNHRRDLVEGDRMFSPMPFFWVGGLVFTLHCAMHAGATLICEQAFEPGATLALLEKERATLVTGWPHYGTAMIDHPSFTQRDLRAIRGGNIYPLLPPEKRPADPELRSNALGMTETCGPHTIDRMDVDLPEEMRGSFGRAPEGVEHKIVDPDGGETLAHDQDGEICIRGYNLMQGLYKMERQDCFDEDGYYHSGDAGRMNQNGVLFFQSRLGDMIKTAGANVTPREVEIIIDEQDEVQASYVVGLPHPDRGQEVAAAVVLIGGADLDADALRDRLKQSLSAYKIPGQIFFCTKEAIPFTDSGKVDKRSLTDYLESLRSDA
ncbi:MAG: class I adenylate-forming enzyme family protein [Pseudomonadota bacterium]